MLSQEDYITAAINNIGQWEWDIKSAYPMEKNEALAVLRVLEMYKTQKLIKELMYEEQKLMDELKGMYEYKK